MELFVCIWNSLYIFSYHLDRYIVNPQMKFLNAGFCIYSSYTHTLLVCKAVSFLRSSPISVLYLSFLLELTYVFMASNAAPLRIVHSDEQCRMKYSFHKWIIPYKLIDVHLMPSKRLFLSYKLEWYVQTISKTNFRLYMEVFRLYMELIFFTR